MSLGDRQHVEAVAIIRALRDIAATVCSEELSAVQGADQWLKENHPEPSVYTAAMSERS